MDETRLEQALAQSPKYSAIDEAVRRRVILALAPRYTKEKDALDAVKRHLHIICGMYQGPREWKASGQLLRGALPRVPTPGLVEETARALLGLHASTRERTEVMTPLYEEVFSHLPPIHSVMDAGCGFHPFARPWMPLSREAHYLAGDLLPEAARQISAFFDWAGYAGQGQVCDLMTSVPSAPADVAFLMKLLPVLEQQEKGRGRHLLFHLPARYLVVTFPTRSIGGRKRGMDTHYAQWMHGQIDGHFHILMETQFGDELLYLLTKTETEENT